jgi:hypothetical protein
MSTGGTTDANNKRKKTEGRRGAARRNPTEEKDR